jgi:hypothetical protein
MSAPRQRLPNRRRSERLSLSFGSIPYVVSYSTFDDGRLGELFIDAAMSGDPLNVLGRDMAITVSLALQHGCSASELSQALERHSDGSAAGPLAAILDLIGEEQR